MHKPLSLKANFSWVLVGNTINAVCMWAIVSVLAKIDANLLGKFELARLVVMPVIVLSMMHLSTLQVTDVKGKYSFSEYYGVRLILSIIGLAVIIVISLIYGKDAGLPIFLWGLAKIIDSVSEINRGLFQRYERMNLTGISLILRGATAILAVCFSMWYYRDLNLALLLTVIIWVGILFWYDLPMSKKLLNFIYKGQPADNSIVPKFEIKTAAALTWAGLPLGSIVFLSTFENSALRGILEHYQGLALLGYFSAVSYPVSVGAMIIDALGQAASPRLAKHFNNDFLNYKRLMVKLFGIGLAMSILIISSVVIFGKMVLTILYRADYAEYQAAFILLSISFSITFFSSFCGFGLTAAKYFRIQLVLKVFTLMTTVLTALLFVPRYHMMGAAISSLASAIIGFLCYFTVFMYIYRKNVKVRSSEIVN